MEVTRDIKKDENNLLSKIVVIGDANVGKTNIIRRIMGEDFREMEATIGVEFMYLNIKDIDKDDPSKSLSIQIWDTSGAERYKAITTSHIRGADGAYIVYDISNESSFNNLDYWYNCIKDSADSDIIIYLIGNKSDLIYEEGRVVRRWMLLISLKIIIYKDMQNAQLKIMKIFKKRLNCFIPRYIIRIKINWLKKLKIEKNI